MIFGILKDGVRGAFVRIVRTIVYFIIIAIVLYSLGSCSKFKNVDKKGGLYELFDKK